jgi:hypothetical protein
VLCKEQQILLPLWVVDAVNFGIEDDEIIHLLRLRPDDGEEEKAGHIELRIGSEENKYAVLILHKEMQMH